MLISLVMVMCLVGSHIGSHTTEARDVKAVDITRPGVTYITQYFRCLRVEGYDYIVLRAYQRTGTLDKTFQVNYRNSRAAGFIVHVYMEPCPLCWQEKSATAQVNEMGRFY